MRIINIEAAMDAAEEFIKRAKEVSMEMREDTVYVGTAKTGALRRQSMELTRALAEMRRV